MNARQLLAQVLMFDPPAQMTVVLRVDWTYANPIGLWLTDQWILARTPSRWLS